MSNPIRIVVNAVPVELSNFVIKDDADTVQFDYSFENEEDQRRLSGCTEFEELLGQTVISLIEQGIESLMREQND
jgi:hypothetical protein